MNKFERLRRGQVSLVHIKLLAENYWNCNYGRNGVLGEPRNTKMLQADMNVKPTLEQEQYICQRLKEECHLSSQSFLK